MLHPELSLSPYLQPHTHSLTETHRERELTSVDEVWVLLSLKGKRTLEITCNEDGLQ